MTSPLFLRSVAATLIGASALTVGLPSISYATGSLTDPNPMTEMDAGLTLNLEEGQILQIILPKRRLGYEARKARSTFEKVVRPALEKNDYQFHGHFNVKQTVVGNSKPSNLEFFTYPNASIKDQLDRNEKWASLLDYRGEGWKRQDIFSTQLPSDLTLKFDPSKYYTLAIAWTNPANPGDYDHYLEGVETEFAEVGARFVHKFRNIEFETRNGERHVPPTQLTIVEWETEAGLNQLLTSEAYKEHSHYFRSGVSDFRFYRLSDPESS